MHLQENSLLDLGVKVRGNVAHCHPHHVTYAPTKFEVLRKYVKEEMHLQENKLFGL